MKETHVGKREFAHLGVVCVCVCVCVFLSCKAGERERLRDSDKFVPDFFLEWICFECFLFWYYISLSHS